MYQIRDEYFSTQDYVKLRLRVYEDGHPNWLVLTHGIGEYSGRYDFLFREFGERFNILCWDLRGHGLSDGKRAWVQKFEHYAHDLVEVLKYLEKQYHASRFFLYGHSMGGLVVSDMITSLIAKSFLPKITGCYLSAPAVFPGGPLGKIASRLPGETYSFLSRLPGLQVPGVVSTFELSNDERIAESYLRDPLCLKKLSSKLLFELMGASVDVYQHRSFDFKFPVHVAVGSDDIIVDPLRIKKFFDTSISSGVFKEFPGGKHELHNEIPEIRRLYLDFLHQQVLIP